jgi:undecaprenyl phosphate-alpha-L-ara4FN deformylase
LGENLVADQCRKGPVVGLRVDVDTLRGTRRGIPVLLDVLAARDIRASIFFSVGPDNMGRHLWRLVRPNFLVKMLRSNAANLYGWGILARGVVWPGPHIGRRCARLMQSASEQGHEIGIHGWDHHKWQARLDRMTDRELGEEIARGVDSLREILGRQPRCSASPGWRCNGSVLALKENYGMNYHSDCRGNSIFRPVLRGAPGTPQIPVTLPTYDEVIGRNGISDDNYNSYLLSRIDPAALNVLTVHAEVEGIAKRSMFESFLDDARARGIRFVPLGEMLPDAEEIAPGSITDASIEGREGPVCIQAA